MLRHFKYAYLKFSWNSTTLYTASEEHLFLRLWDVLRSYISTDFKSIKFHQERLGTSFQTQWRSIRGLQLHSAQCSWEPHFIEPKFIKTSISVRRLSLSKDWSIRFTPPYPTSWRSILILSPYLCLVIPSELFASGVHLQNPVCTSQVPHTCHKPRPALHLIIRITMVRRTDYKSITGLRFRNWFFTDRYM